MKKSILLTFLSACLGVVACGQAKAPKEATSAANTLLWRISGNGLAKPSYLFGTMHALCGDDIQLSDSLKRAIQTSDNVYLELDMDNMFEMMGAIGGMRMKGDTTLADLLSAAEYKRVKQHFEEGNSMLPFSMLESFKPLMVAALLAEQQSSGACGKMVAMEQLIMAEAKREEKSIKGLETMKFQLGIFDKIPYKVQAQQLYQAVTQATDTTGGTDIAQLTEAYRSQKLETLERLMLKEDLGMKNFTDLLLYNRNEDWAKKLATLMPQNSLVVAVGAGHLPGKRGVINLLRQAGYTVQPVKNEMIRSRTKEI